MVSVHTNGQTVPSISAIGNKTQLVAMENQYMMMETFMKEIGKTTKPTAMGNTVKKMVQSSKVIGKTISNMVKEQKFGETPLNTKVIILMERSKDMVYLLSMMEVITKDNSIITLSIIKEFISGNMGRFMMGIGLIIR